MATPEDCPIIERETRRHDDPWRADITQQMQAMSQQHTQLKKAVEDNTSITKEIQANTKDIVEFFEAGKGFFTMASYVGMLAKWVTAVAAAIVAVWAAVKWGNR